jgi:hypothetical protein
MDELAVEANLAKNFLGQLRTSQLNARTFDNPLEIT